mgnify:CR=1 FL=1
MHQCLLKCHVKINSAFNNAMTMQIHQVYHPWNPMKTTKIMVPLIPLIPSEQGIVVL